MGVNMNNLKEKRRVWKPFLALYTKIHIPWWLFILSLLCGILYAEITLKIVEYTIRINRGELFNSVIIGYVLLTVLNSVIIMLQIVLSEYGTQKIIVSTRLLLWKKILNLPMKEIEKRQPSSLVSGVVNDVTQASVTISRLFLFGSSAYGFTRACTVLYGYKADLALYLLMAVPVAILVFLIVGKLQFKVLRKQYAALNDMTQFFAEHLSCAKHVKAQVMEEREIEAGMEAINKRYRADNYYAVMSTVQVLLNSLYTSLCTVITAVGGSALIREGKMEATGINTFETYTQRVNQYLAEILTQYQDLKGAQGALRSVNEILQSQEESQTGTEYWLNDTEKDITFEQVSFSYTEGNKVLDDVTFTIPYGKTTALVGDNGSGKSTVLKLMQGLYLPDSGIISIGNNNLVDTRLSGVRGKFGYVLQHNTLFGGTIRANIAYGIKGEVEEEIVIRAAVFADAHNFIKELPEGYETEVGENGCRLSGGQKQRIAIARVLALNPEYLLLDESGASLDHQSDMRIYQSIRNHMKGKTVVVIAHDMDEVMEADQIIVLNKGRVEAAGSHEELLKQSPTYQLYVKKQMKREAV
jgi:ATP-binding cassette subfamily B protein AbcA/BmrA